MSRTYDAACVVCNPEREEPDRGARRLSVSMPDYLAAFARSEAERRHVTLSRVVEDAVRHLQHQEASA